MNLFLFVVMATVGSYRPVPPVSTPAAAPEDVCISSLERDLYQQINAYRKKRGLKAIPLSASLTYVAQQHCLDLVNNRPDQEKKKCNPHSWSENIRWNGCCYTPDHKQSRCMWDKPRELTGYPGDGYEIISTFYSSSDQDATIEPETAMQSWKASSPHHAVLANRSIWKSVEWNALGIGIRNGYAIAWFGKEQDPAGSPMACN